MSDLLDFAVAIMALELRATLALADPPWPACRGSSDPSAGVAAQLFV